MPGPVAYGRGGTRPTVTDAAVVLGYIDPDYFLGGRMPLDRKAAEAAIAREVADPLGRALEEAAASILELATENMVQAIIDITVNQGIDPTAAAFVAGGGAGGPQLRRDRAPARLPARSMCPRPARRSPPPARSSPT